MVLDLTMSLTMLKKKSSAVIESAASFVPVNMRVFASTMFGSEANITEKDFSASDKQALKEAVIRVSTASGKKEGVISYGDYGKGGFSNWEEDPSFGGTSLSTIVFDSFNDPRFRLETTLGAARYKIENGNVIITDTYDFAASKEKLEKLKNEKGTMNVLKEAFQSHGWSGLLNAMGNLKMGGVKKRKVHINLGKVA